jgi:branched-chain amino acid transport system ATP-binding protein
MSDPILMLDGVSKSFGKVRVLEDVNIHLTEGELLGVVGPNGAGKSTLFNIVAGDLSPDSGRVTYHGQDITRRRPSMRSQAGIGRTYQIPRPFEKMTVFENALVSASHAGRLGRAAAGESAVDALALTGLSLRANDLAGRLTLLDRKRLEVARAVAASPTLLLLDEIAGGLTDPEVADLLDIVRALRSRGITIVWIEHVVHALLAIADRMTCLTYGKVLMTGEPAAVMSSREVQEVYLGAVPETQDGPIGGSHQP